MNSYCNHVVVLNISIYLMSTEKRMLWENINKGSILFGS